MKLTDYLAIWGAVLSTILALWSIYKDYLKRYRVKVDAGFRVVFKGDGSPRTDVFAVTVTNLSAHKVKVTHCAIYEARVFRPRWINRLTRKFVHRSGQAYLFAFQPLHGDSLPITIESLDNHILTYSVDDFPPTSEVAVTTADGREWFASRKDIQKIRKDRVYQAAQQRRQAVSVYSPCRSPSRDDADIESQAKRRMADEYDAAQDRGQVRKNGERSFSDPEKLSSTEAVKPKLLHEARQIRDAMASWVWISSAQHEIHPVVVNALG
jgi:hypothetical protein